MYVQIYLSRECDTKWLILQGICSYARKTKVFITEANYQTAIHKKECSEFSYSGFSFCFFKLKILKIC